MEQTESKTLKENFVNSIKSRILSGELKPGDKLKPERELALEMQISRGSVNQGILDLERMGFLRVVPRKGTFVAEYISSATPETLSAIMSYDSALIDSKLFRDFMDLRILVERECVRLVCRRMDSQIRKAISELIDAIESGTGDALFGALYEFHHSLVLFSGNGAYAIIFQSFEIMLKNMIIAHYKNKRQVDKCLPLYRKLAYSLSLADADQADELICEILNNAMEYLNQLLSKERKVEQ